MLKATLNERSRRLWAGSEAHAIGWGGVAMLARALSWRRQRDAGQFGKSPRKRGPVAAVPDPRDERIAELERRLRRTEAQRDRYERLCALQKKVSELFGVSLETESELKS
jgi:hypothetical protein